MIKRRTLAKDASDAGRITVNGRIAKPSTEVKAGDILEIGFGAKKVKVEVLDVKENVRAEEAKNLYRILEES